MLSSTKSRTAGKTFLLTLFFFLLVTQICFAQWVQLGLEDKAIKDIAARNSNIFAITSDSGIVYRSIDNGTNWTVVVDSTAIDIAISPLGKVFMVKDSVLNNSYWHPSALFSSSDNGDTWTRSNIMEQLIDSIPDGRPISITIDPGGIVFCGLDWIGAMLLVNALAKSTDDGLTWTTPGKGVIGGNLFDFRGQSVITFGRAHAAMNLWSYFYLSSDNGQTWLELGNYFGNPFANVLSTCSNGSVLIGSWDWYGNTGLGLFLSTDACSSWTQVSLLTPKAGLSIETGGILFGTDSLGVFLFSDNGDSLGSFNQGLTNLKTHTLSMDDNGYVYLGTDNGVWRRPLSEVTLVEENQIKNPSSYNLSQNFPNPFNPSTTLGYSIPTQSNVVIKVFDILGNEIALLMNEEKTIGTYELTWNAASLPSGVYFYQLLVSALQSKDGKAGDFIQTKKMLLLK